MDLVAISYLGSFDLQSCHSSFNFRIYETSVLASAMLLSYAMLSRSVLTLTNRQPDPYSQQDSLHGSLLICVLPAAWLTILLISFGLHLQQFVNCFFWIETLRGSEEYPWTVHHDFGDISGVKSISII